MNRISIVLATLFALCGVTADAHALEKYMSRTRGNQASFQAWTSTDCGAEAFYLSAFEEAGGPSGPYSGDVLYLDYWKYDWCTGESSWGSMQLDGASFDITRLKSANASVSATMGVETCHLVDGGGPGIPPVAGSGAAGSGEADGGVSPPWYPTWVCEHTDVPIDLDLTWTASGPVYRDRSNYSYSTPYSRYRSTYSGQSVDATMSGFVSIGDVELDPSSGYGSLGHTQSGSFEMYR